MSSKPENTFIAAVHRKLDKSVYREKMANPYRGGTPDVWYSGAKRDLWIEYKFIPKLAVRVPNKIDLSELQRQWIENRTCEGRNIAVVVGSPEGCIILRWPVPREIETSEFRERAVPKERVAYWIEEQVGVPNDL